MKRSKHLRVNVLLGNVFGEIIYHTIKIGLRRRGCTK